MNNRNKYGISLVEILVVIAILAVLAAILMPMFISAKESAYQAKCVSNLRQFAVAFDVYATDWTGRWPAPGGRAGDKTYWAQSGSGGLQGYIHQTGKDSVWCCPHLKGWNCIYPARSYSMNSYLRTPIDTEYPTCTYEGFQQGINLMAIEKPSRTILLYEGLAFKAGYEGQAEFEYIYRCANWKWVRGYATRVAYATTPEVKPWHGNKNNYLYADGHIVSRAPGKRTAPDLSTDDEMFEWYASKQYYRTLWVSNYSKKVAKATASK